MKSLLEYIIKGIVDKSDFEIEESSDTDHVSFNIKANQDSIGMIIGKDGKTIRAIRNIMKVKSTLKDIPVSVTVTES